MARYDFRASRLFVDAPLAAGASVALDRGQANYLVNAMRLALGDQVLLFNGRDGEWRADLAAASRKSVVLRVIEQTRPQTAPADLHYLFAPLKHARLDYMVQKAVEMGASVLHPVLTRRSQAERVNLGRMRANAIEAAEQCGILTLPEIVGPTPFDELVAGWTAEHLLVFCDEDAEVGDPVRALNRAGGEDEPPVSVLIGPEGGFAAEERAALCRLPRVVRISLGPRILRADTAAVAALTLVQAVLGDWR
ncbi:MAG TPA: 16S rRNA (uracil(1498)-N(3))-methyltransferase [Xanthobacteraceae bacterium]|nr:16S rRNA (uracil(1498)-N(3))-methyltransferase [Xanthobacteraceae bacterium]